MRFLFHHWDHLLRATRYSLKGLRAVWRETAFRQELAVLLFATPLALWLGSSPLERALLIGSWLLVMVIECLNCAVEAITDRVGTERHALSGQAKDAGSAAVFLAILTAISTWLVVLLS
ncbi:MAG: diacylglycerol kinase [bacterium]|nr:diacylglycerol kinase [bacterium]